MFTIIANTKRVALDRKHVFNVFYHRQISVIANKSFSFVTCFTTSVEFKTANRETRCKKTCFKPQTLSGTAVLKTSACRR